jgi:acyl-CoA dehydrogenase
MRELIAEAARGILSRPVEPWRSWAPLLEGGWIGIGVEEADGGQGGTLVEAAAVAEAAGATAVAAPVVESILAAIVLGSCAATRGLLAELADGTTRAALVPEVVRSDRSGCVADLELVVPWGREATLVVLIAVLAEGGLGLAPVPLHRLAVTHGQTLAGDPLDRLRLPSAQLPARVSALDVPLARLIDIAAVLSAARLCGALRAVARMSVEYANQRTQFGLSIGSFQVLAHALAQQEAWVAQAEAALVNALAATEFEDSGVAEAAHVAAVLAIDRVVKVAHQVHGAIGVTREHDLHRYTLRLTAWRSEFGAASWWSRRLGRRTVANERWRDRIAPALVG